MSDVKVKLWSMNETRAFAAWLRTLKGQAVQITSVRMNQTTCTVEVFYELLVPNLTLLETMG